MSNKIKSFITVLDILFSLLLIGKEFCFHFQKFGFVSLFAQNTQSAVCILDQTIL